MLWYRAYKRGILDSLSTTKDNSSTKCTVNSVVYVARAVYLRECCSGIPGTHFEYITLRAASGSSCRHMLVFFHVSGVVGRDYGSGENAVRRGLP